MNYRYDTVEFAPIEPYLPPFRTFDAAMYRMLNRAKATGRLSLNAADRISCHVVGVHPSTFWPEVFAR